MADLSVLDLGKDHRGHEAFALYPVGYVDNVVLAADTNETKSVPTGAGFVLFAATGDFWAFPNGNAAIPSADVLDGTASILNPVMWLLGSDDRAPVTTIGLIASATTAISLQYFSAR